MPQRFGMNMQKPMFGDPSGLTDTMWDLIVDAAGTLAVPSTITQVLGEKLTEQHLSVGSYGAGAARAAGGGATPSVHAHGDKKDEVDIDRDRFFRAIDRAILEHYSRPSGLPLMLATLTEYHAPFREVSHNPFLMPESIQVNPKTLSLDQLRVQAWQNVEPLYLKRLAKLAESYQIAHSRNLGSDDLAQVAQAAIAGRVGTLLVEDNREIAGRIAPAAGHQTAIVELHGVDVSVARGGVAK